MNDAQIYAIVAPLVLLLASAVGAYWWVHRPYPEDSGRKPR